MNVRKTGKGGERKKEEKRRRKKEKQREKKSEKSCQLMISMLAQYFSFLLIFVLKGEGKRDEGKGRKLREEQRGDFSRT